MLSGKWMKILDENDVEKKKWKKKKYWKKNLKKKKSVCCPFRIHLWTIQQKILTI